MFLFVMVLGLGSSAYQAHSQKRLPSSRAEVSLSFAPLVKRAAPAVVNIFTKKRYAAVLFLLCLTIHSSVDFLAKNFNLALVGAEKYKIHWDLV